MSVVAGLLLIYVLFLGLAELVRKLCRVGRRLFGVVRGVE